jgi:transposase InsO family protein
MLVELGLVEQRYQAVLEVLDGVAVIEVARRNGVSRQTVHEWLHRYSASGLAGLADRSSRPDSCPHQMPAVVEARVVEMRKAHPGWGPATILYWLGKRNVEPLPSRSAVYRALVRHGLVDTKTRKRRKEDFKRWERGRSMELWQMDIVGRIFLTDGTDVKAVTGIDDHSRFCVCARLVARPTAKPVCDALAQAMRAHGVPDQILTDNGKVFTARFGTGPGPVHFDRVCTQNGVEHILTAPYSPTTTGKVERFHKTMRKEWERPNHRRFPTIVEAQASLDAWVHEYNTQRPHQSLGMVPPMERFALAQRRDVAVDEELDDTAIVEPARGPRPAGVTRWVDQRGRISLAKFSYRVGATYAGEPVEVVCHHGLVEILHAGVVVATHAQRLRPDDKPAKTSGPRPRRPRAATSGMTVTRVADNGGTISFAGAAYRAGRVWARKNVHVAIVANSVQLSVADTPLHIHPIRHDRTKEHGAFATPNGRPRKPKTA